MLLNDRFQVAVKVKKLIGFIDKITINYPRGEYVLKDKMQSTSLEILELVYLANIMEDKENIQKKILSKLSMIDFYFELSYEKMCINQKKLSIGVGMLEEITKMLYGWIKSCESQVG